MKVESKLIVITVAAIGGFSHGIADPPTDLQRVAAQCLGARPSVDRQHVLQQVSRNSVWHQGRQPGL
ncbi:MAG: hypothetical protein ACJ8AW_53335 [Rhodopila sp.]|jgi:hypothetical protein